MVSPSLPKDPIEPGKEGRGVGVPMLTLHIHNFFNVVMFHGKKFLTAMFFEVWMFFQLLVKTFLSVSLLLFHFY